MSQMINLRHKDGSVQPVYETKQVKHFLGLQYDNIFIHKNAGYANWIGYNTAGGMFWFATGIDAAGDPVVKNPIATLDNTILVENIEQMGNIVIVTNADGIHYFFFKDGGYVLIPNLDIFNSLIIKPEKRTTNTEPVCPTSIYGASLLNTWAISNGYYTSWSQLEGLGDDISVDDPVTEVDKIKLSSYWAGQIPKIKKTLDEDHGWLYGCRFVRFAVKLYDGSYVMHSAPILIMPPSSSDSEFLSHNTFMNNGVGPYHIYAYYLTLYKLKCVIPSLGDISNIKGIIDGVDVFMSQEIQRLDYNRGQIVERFKDGSPEMVPNNIATLPDSTPSEAAQLYRVYEISSFLDDIKDSSLFYKIHSIPLDKFVSGAEDLIVTKNTRDILPTHEALPDDDYTHNKIAPRSTYVLNQKLHTGDLKTTLFGGFSPLHFASQYFASTLKCMFEVQIRTAEGVKSVYSDIIPSGAPVSLICPMIGYPDYRADKMIQWSYWSGTLYKREFPLTKHSSLNYAYYLESLFAQINILNINAMTSMGAAAADVLEVKKASTVCIETTPDKIKVSRVANPFYFAAENTYGTGAKVIAMRSVNESVSEGTAFGTMPLYVFTEDGIKLMEVGTGSVYYSRIIDGPREVCVNSKSVMSLKNGILFTSNRGLIHLSGLTTVCVTDQLRSEFLDNLIADSKITVALNNPKISTLANFTDNYSFDNIYEKILDISQMAYNDRENEVVIVSKNSLNQPLCYVWNVEQNLWHVATYKIKYFIKCFEDLYYVRSDDASGLNVHNLKTQTKPMDALLITRPMKIIPDVFKRVSRVYLRSQVRLGADGVVFTDNVDVEGGRYQRLLVYGSNDAINWFLLGGSDNNGTVRSLGVKTSSTSYKLFRFVYCGQPFQVSKFDCLEFDYIEVEYSVTMNNKLR